MVVVAKVVLEAKAVARRGKLVATLAAKAVVVTTVLTQVGTVAPTTESQRHATTMASPSIYRDSAPTHPPPFLITHGIQ